MATRAADIAEDALQLVGVLPPGAKAARPSDFAKALRWLSSHIGFLGGTLHLKWLSRFWVIALEPEVSSYDIAQATELGAGCCGPQFINQWHSAVLLRDIHREPLHLLRREEWIQRCIDPRLGMPDAVWIEPIRRPVMHVWPKPHREGLSVEIGGTIAPGSFEDAVGSTQIPLPDEWRPYLAHATALLISNGVVVRLNDRARAQIQQTATDLFERLFARSQPEHHGPMIAEAYDY